MSDKEFLNKYEELLNKDYCNCNEMNCIDNNSPRRILNIAKRQQEEIERLRKDIEWFKKYVRIVNTIELHCLNSINAINDILETEKIIKFSKNGRCLNKYQIERLKAYRTNSKEILKLIRRLENTYYGKEVK